MKHYFLLTFITFQLVSYSQKIKFGPELGMNIIQVQKQDIGNNYQLGWHTGIAFQYEFSKLFSIKSGLYYTQKRQSFNEFDTLQSPIIGLLGGQGLDGFDLSTYSETNGRHTLNYLQIPILANFTHKNISINVGGYIGYMFNSRTKKNETKRTPFVSTIDINSLIPGGIGGFIPLPPAYEENFTESTNGSGLSVLDFGFKGGLSYQFDNLNLNGSYIYGLKNYKTSSNLSNNNNNSYFQISLSYLLGIGKKGIVHHSKL